MLTSSLALFGSIGGPRAAGGAGGSRRAREIGETDVVPLEDLVETSPPRSSVRCKHRVLVWTLEGDGKGEFLFLFPHITLQRTHEIFSPRVIF